MKPDIHIKREREREREKEREYIYRERMLEKQREREPFRNSYNCFDVTLAICIYESMSAYV